MSNQALAKIGDVGQCRDCSSQITMTLSRKKHGRYLCNNCSNKRVKDWVARNPERAKEQSRLRTRKWQLTNPEKLPSKEDKRQYDRSHYLKWKYGMTDGQYRQLLADQGSVCGICKTDTPNGKYGIFFIDHCHKTGVIRGILCSKCNLGIGSLGDDPERLRRAADYIEKSLLIGGRK